ncbi:MAG: 3D domain-containing protein [Minicystis sp.]
MRPLTVIAAICFSGAAVVTLIAQQGDTTAAEPPGTAPPPGAADLHAHVRPGPSAVEPAPSAPDPATVRASHKTAPVDSLFWNTYYDFPEEPRARGETPIYTARCELISVVPRAFHDRLCVQGSGKLASGETVSFAGRDCACAAVCPKTGQRICYDVLEPDRFPCGRGATGRAITPLRTVAVDPTVIPMGQRLFIPEYVGLPLPNGAPHDGCFVAEDQGIKIKGHRIDIFAGDEATRRAWNAMVPSKRGVHVYSGDGRCKGSWSRERRSCATRHR